MSLVGKIKKKYRYIQSNWQADIRFSKKYAKLRRKDIISSTIGLKKVSDRAFKQREQYILTYLADTIQVVINKYKNLGIPYRLEGIEAPSKEEVRHAKYLLGVYYK